MTHVYSSLFSADHACSTLFSGDHNCSSLFSVDHAYSSLFSVDQFLQQFVLCGPCLQQFVFCGPYVQQFVLYGPCGPERVELVHKSFCTKTKTNEKVLKAQAANDSLKLACKEIAPCTESQALQGFRDQSFKHGCLSHLQIHRAV